MKPDHIVFFDGSCGLCHWSVQFILRWDKKKIFYFSPLNSEFGKKALINTDAATDTFYLKSSGHLYQKSEGAIKTLILLGGFWSLLGQALNLLPTQFLNFVYDVIAKFRIQLFGTKTSCDLLSKDQKGRFIF